MAARKDKQGRRMVSDHYVKDAFFFMQDLHEALLMNEIQDFSQTDARYAQRLVEELDEMRPLIQKLANNLEANSPADIITNWKDL
jgi:hypothetical protein|tara:strand:+ start:354 stop:608 length:255 start_codon:yes stop_codon:yes gene_type:complete